MSIQQPDGGVDNLDSPDHSLSHRVFANDDSAPVQRCVVDSSGQVYNGNYIGGDRTKFEADGTMVYEGDATVFEDVNINPLLGFSTPFFGDFPDIIQLASTNISCAGFSPTAEEGFDAGFEIPHATKLGANISFHVHWAPTNTNTGVVRWGLQYVFFREGTGAVSTGTTIYINDTAGGTAWVKQTATFADITPPASELGLQFGFRLFRDATDVADTYNADAAITTTVGAHCEYNMGGSRQILVK